MDREVRITTYKNQINRLDRRIKILQKKSGRYSWIRLAIILIGLSISLFLYLQYSNKQWVVLSILVTVIMFSVIAYYHRHIDDWIRTYEIWKELKTTHLARMQLDWENIPISTRRSGRLVTPFEVDLDLIGPNSIHHLIDISISNEGSDRLLDWLSQSAPDLEHIDRTQNLVQDLVPLTLLRDRLYLIFKRISNRNLEGDKLLKWLDIPIQENKLIRYLLIFSALIFTNIFLFILYNFNYLPPYWIVTIPLYIALYLAVVGSIKPLFEAIVLMDSELEKFKRILYFLEKYPYGHHEYLKQFCSPFLNPANPPTKQLKKIKLTTSAIGVRSNPIVGLLLNIVFPWDMLFALLINRYRAELINILPVWLDRWSDLEALISLANFAFLNPDYSFPDIVNVEDSTKFDQPAVFKARDLGHPLIPPEEKTCNDFQVQNLGEIAIITGSNMAGKSTFVKTLGVNLCLAYAGGPVNASQFQSIPLRLHTCIKISDSLTNGFSYFYSEVKCLRALLDKLDSDEHFPLLYLIDEIFRGTNNQERLIGSKAYVHNLIGKDGIGLIATHDLELANLAKEDNLIYNYHFKDEVVDGILVFDYVIRSGPSPTTNALKIMKLEGLPIE